MAKKETVTETVTMEDGRVVDFVGEKRKMLKESIVGADGTLQIRLDFRNGQTRLFTIPQEDLANYALHGASQKLGDEAAGLTDIDDIVLAVDNLIDRLYNHEWTATRESSGLAGTSVLLRALVEHSGKSVEAIKTFLSTKTQADKVALRNSPRVKPIIERMEAEKAAKAGEKVDTEAMLGELEAA